MNDPNSNKKKLKLVEAITWNMNDLVFMNIHLAKILIQVLTIYIIFMTSNCRNGHVHKIKASSREHDYCRFGI